MDKPLLPPFEAICFLLLFGNKQENPLQEKVKHSLEI
jgi:hypothetical protein